MGIHDRDYARPSANRAGYGPLSSMRLWSFNTWLIIINVMVFLTDWGFQTQNVYIETSMGRYAQQGVNLSDHQWGESNQIIPPGTLPDPRFARYSARTIVDRQSGALLGYHRITAMPPLESVGHFSSGRLFYQLEIWRLVTFQFLHANSTHLLMNMFGLWMFGPLVEGSISSRKRYAAYYLTCGIFGAVAYMLLSLFGVVVTDPYMPLVGASAGCFGVLMAAAYFAGNDMMYVFGVIPLKIRTGAYLLSALAAFNILRQGSNAGGDAAHVGGAIAGYFFIRRLDLLRDFFDVFGRSSPKTGPAKRPRGGAARGSNVAQKSDDRLDAILAKVRSGGMDSLSDDERAYLQNATRERGG